MFATYPTTIGFFPAGNNALAIWQAPEFSGITLEVQPASWIVLISKTVDLRTSGKVSHSLFMAMSVSQIIADTCLQFN